MVKRIFAALLTLAMLLSVCSVEVFAADDGFKEIYNSGTVALEMGEAYKWLDFSANYASSINVSELLTALNTEDAQLVVTWKAEGSGNLKICPNGIGDKGKCFEHGFGASESEQSHTFIVSDIITDEITSLVHNSSLLTITSIVVKVPTSKFVPVDPEVPANYTETYKWNPKTAVTVSGWTDSENISFTDFTNFYAKLKEADRLEIGVDAASSMNWFGLQCNTGDSYPVYSVSTATGGGNGTVISKEVKYNETHHTLVVEGEILQALLEAVAELNPYKFIMSGAGTLQGIYLYKKDADACAHDGDFTYVPNEDGTHQKICAICEEVVDDAEDCNKVSKSEYAIVNTSGEFVEDVDSEDIDPSDHWVLLECEDCGQTFYDYDPHVFGDDVITYETTETGHIKVTTKTCTLCGAVIVEKGEETAHEYDETTGECVCGKEKPECTHATTEAVEVATNDKTHNVVCTDECGEIIGTEAHTYKDGVCTECGHKCTHASATEETVKSYKDNEDGTHTLTTTVTSTCADCETVTEKTTETVEKHTFKDGKCVCEADEPEITVEVEQKEGAPAASVNTAAVEALKKEFGADASEDVEVSLVVEDATATVPAADKALVELDTTYTVGQYLNIELLVNEAPKTEVSTKVTITIAIPESLLAENRTFSIVHVHDGLVSVLQDEDSDPLTITFSTSKFSTFAIVHRDAPAKEKETTVGRTPDMPNTRFGAYIVDMGPYHGVIYAGRIISMPHTYNAAGVCTSCGHER